MIEYLIFDIKLNSANRNRKFDGFPKIFDVLINNLKSKFFDFLELKCY